MKFDANQIRSTRKIMQWSVVPMAILAVLTLSHPILPIAFCFAALATLLAAVCAGVDVGGRGIRGSPWLWRKAMALPRREEWSAHWFGEEGTYRSPPRPENPSRVVGRRLHWFTRVMAMMPAWMGGGGLGWRLFKRRVVRSFDEWDRTPSGPGDRLIQGVVDEMHRRKRYERALALVNSTHVECSGRSCKHCNDITSAMEVDDG